MRLTGGTPYCASCFQQQPELAHVDFEASYDGPVLEGSVKVAIDDLVLCQNCLRAAFRLLDIDERQKDVAKLEQRVLSLQQEASDKDRYIEQLENAVKVKPGADGRQPVKRREPVEA